MVRLRALRRITFLIPVLALASGCQSAAPPSVESPVQARMFSHFALAMDLRTFVVNGDLERLRVTAGELSVAEETWGLPPGSEPFVETVHAAARRAAEASNLDAAARAVADVALACGSCHLANQTSLGARFQVAAPLLTDPATRHTNYLSWVSRLLWDGVLGPSETMWQTGAGALAGGEGVPPPRASYVPQSEVMRAAESLKELGVEAVLAADPEARAQILADVWMECAGCHTQAGVR
jgi:cytochrome c553